jgi:hypothetical protein
MSSDPDRIAVPTNGRGPHPVPDPLAPSEPASESGSGAPSEEEMSTAFSPKQLAIGFGIVASLLLLLAGRARRRRSGD